MWVRGREWFFQAMVLGQIDAYMQKKKKIVLTSNTYHTQNLIQVNHGSKSENNKAYRIKQEYHKTRVGEYF